VPPFPSQSLLLGTGDAIICEATRSDQIWGMGLNCGDPKVQSISAWRGTNVLGWALMQARDALRPKHSTGGHFPAAAAQQE
jgi:hypothetical protein